MEKINCITGIKNRWGDGMAEHSIVFAGSFCIPLVLVFVQKASHSVLSDWQP
jgi:hypothetical protein